MERKVIGKLQAWYESPQRRPLVVRGARQVGKTWAVCDFAARRGDYVYVNFEDDRQLRDLFEKDFDMTRILTRIALLKNHDIGEDTLLVLDELQEAPHGITSLKYFAEKRPSQPVIAAGSLLGVALHQGDSFPVGKVDFIDVRPMDFEEFLWAVGQRRLADVVGARDWEMVAGMADKLESLLRLYYFVGGMPKAVSLYVETGSLQEVRAEHRRLLDSYANDFSKHAPVALVPRIRDVWNSTVAQLSRENRKFIYGIVRSGARAREYEVALQWLFDAGLLCRVSRCKSGAYPLKSYVDQSAFKVFMLDVGLFSAMAEVDAASIIESSDALGMFKGGLTEQYVCQQLLARDEITSLYYWSADNSSGEVDFLVQQGGAVVPIEVKAEENLRSKSLRAFSERYSIPRSIRTSMSPYRQQEWLTNIPLYALYAPFFA